MRIKECQQMAGQIEKLDTEIDSLRARLAAAVSDRDKAELSLQEAHHLLGNLHALNITFYSLYIISYKYNEVLRKQVFCIAWVFLMFLRLPPF